MMDQTKWRTAILGLVIGVGVLAGVGGFTFFYANGFSYFSTRPEACMNCHIMKPQYDAWLKSSHHTAAKCVDCHLPHSFIPKYLAKGDNGYRHSKGFTFQNFHEPIMITEKNSRILNDNCLRCHASIAHAISPALSNDGKQVACVHCHRGVGHGETTGMGRYDPKEGKNL